MSSHRLIPKLLPVLFVGLALAVAWLYQRPQDSSAAGDPSSSERSSTQKSNDQKSNDHNATVDTTRGGNVLDGRRSGTMVEVTGSVSRLLADDNEGSRHQRFILAFQDGTTVLVAHNIDLAPRVPIEAGDSARIRGQYEWNERGGVLHWTHHDPDGSRRDTGWIEHDGRVYQ